MSCNFVSGQPAAAAAAPPSRCRNKLVAPRRLKFLPTTICSSAVLPTPSGRYKPSLYKNQCCAVYTQVPTDNCIWPRNDDSTTTTKRNGIPARMSVSVFQVELAVALLAEAFVMPLDLTQLGFGAHTHTQTHKLHSPCTLMDTLMDLFSIFFSFSFSTSTSTLHSSLLQSPTPTSYTSLYLGTGLAASFRRFAVVCCRCFLG